MTVTLKPKTETAVPNRVLRKAGYRPGDQLEFKVSGRIITISPKLTPDEIEDARELRDPRVRRIVQEGYQEFLAGKTRPIEEHFAERATKGAKRTRRRSGA